MSSAGLTETLQETLALFGGSGEPRTTVEVAERLDLGRRSTYDRLERLVEEDRLETKKVGSKARVWWRSPESFDREVSDRRTRERELEKRIRQQEVSTELSQRALEACDPNALTTDAVQFVAETLGTDYCKVLDLDADSEQLLLCEGVGWDEGIVGEATVSSVENDSQAAYTLTSEQPVVVESLENEPRFSGPDLLTDHDVQSGISVIIGSRDEPWGILGTHDTDRREFSDHDVTFVQSVANTLATAIRNRQSQRELASQQRELYERERALRRAYEVIVDPDQEFQGQIEALLGVVRETIGVDYATLSQTHRDQYVFEAIDAPADAELSSGDSVPLETTNCERTIATERTLALREVETDAPELADRAGNADWGISCYLGSPVSVDDDVYGTFCFYDMEARAEEFSDWEVAFVELLSNWVGNELERQRDAEQLTAMNNLSGVAREITETVIDQSTRAEIEQAVCDQLAASESYKFAWLAEVEPGTEQIRSRVEAGVDDFLENIELSADPDEEIGQGPAGKAFRTGELWVSQDVFTDPAFEPWRHNAETYGFRSFAAIPVVHDQTLYGVLGVYSERGDAFADTEREVIGQLGEVIGHAIAAIDRKQALMSDEVVELEFRISGFLDEMGIEDDIQGAIELDEAVSIGADNYVVYGRASIGSIDSISSLVETIPHWTDVTFREVDGETQFELRLSEPPVISVLAGLGGSIEHAVIEDGEYRLTLRLAPSTDTSQLIDAVQEAYPTAEMVARRQSAQNTESAEKLETRHTEALTDKQRGALSAAYHAGFFEWPRNASGEDIAESLDVAGPTFHQHLRKAERKVFDTLL